MKVSEHWLKDFVDIPVTTQVLADQLTHAGIEIECIEQADFTTDRPHYDILTLKIPPNRGDCLSIEGIAREISALNAIDYRMPMPSPVPSVHTSVEDLPVKLEAPEACSHYMGRTITGLNIEVKTPAWMQQRLVEAGIRCVSPIVDVTNYVMIELGQPLHAFDRKKLNAEVIVRFAKPGESITLLDGQTLALNADTLVIADQKVPLAIAGIMGGKGSSVAASTDSIFLESAYFNPIPIRLTARHYGLRTDSSFRFERTVDPNLQGRALECATQWLLSIMGGTAGPVVECCDKQHHPKIAILLLRRKQIKVVLGSTFSDAEIMNILMRLGMKVEQNEEGWSVEVPSFRSDIQLEIDLIEEIGRVIGFHRFPSQMPTLSLNPVVTPEACLPVPLFKKTMVDRGYAEAMTYSFVERSLLDLIQDPSHIPLTLLNPIAEQSGAMRTTLLAGLLQALQYNEHRQQSRVRLFETGLVFPEQKPMIAGVVSGSVMPLQWGLPLRTVDFYDVKSDIMALVALTKNQDALRFEPGTHPALYPGKAASIYLGNTFLGTMGVLHPTVLKALDLSSSVVVFELELSVLVKAHLPVFKPLSKYPSIRRDLAIIVDANVLASSIKSAIVKQVGEYLQEVTIFDVYQGKGIPAGKKSVALSLNLQHPSRTWVESEINEWVQGVVLCLAHHFQATLRE